MSAALNLRARFGRNRSVTELDRRRQWLVTDRRQRDYSRLTSFGESLDFDGAVAHLLELVGSVVDVRISGADGRPRMVANFGGLLLGGDQADPAAAATGDEQLMFDLEDPDGTHHYGMFMVGRADFEGAELEGGLVLHVRLGGIGLRVMPEQT